MIALLIGLRVRPIVPRDVVEVQSDEPIGVPQAKTGGDVRAPVAALRGKFLVAQLGHQPGPQIGDGERVHPGVPRRVGEEHAGLILGRSVRCRA